MTTYATKMPAHPAKKFYTLATAMAFISLVLCCVASAVPQWSRVKGSANIVETQAAGSMPFTSTSVTDDSILYMGHWQYCLEYGDRWYSFTCATSGSGTVPTYGSKLCYAHFSASRILMIAAIVFAFLALLACGLCMMKTGKWKAGEFWSPPFPVSLAAFVLYFISFGCIVASLVNWGFLAEAACRSDPQPAQRMQGYSTSFILGCVAAGLMLLGMLFSCMGVLTIKKIPQYVTEEVTKQDPVVYDEREYPVTYDNEFMAPVSYPTSQFPSTPVY